MRYNRTRPSPDGTDIIHISVIVTVVIVVVVVVVVVVPVVPVVSDVVVIVVVTCCRCTTASQRHYVIAAAGLQRRRCGAGYVNHAGGCGDPTACVARIVTPRLYTPLCAIIMVVAATMASMDDHERKIVVEFCQLLEQSKQLFNGLR